MVYIWGEKPVYGALILKEISPEYSLEGLILKQKLHTLVTWCEELTHWKRPWCWERLKAGGEGDNRGWDGWMATPTWWKWVWVSSGSWWWRGKPGVLQSMGSQRVRHDWATEPNWTHGALNTKKRKLINVDYLMPSILKPFYIYTYIHTHVYMCVYIYCITEHILYLEK